MGIMAHTLHMPPNKKTKPALMPAPLLVSFPDCGMEYYKVCKYCFWKVAQDEREKKTALMCSIQHLPSVSLNIWKSTSLTNIYMHTFSARFRLKTFVIHWIWERIWFTFNLLFSIVSKKLAMQGRKAKEFSICAAAL